MSNLKIFNFGLPRTGTTSFHNFILSNNIRSLHSNKDEIDRIFPIEYSNYIEDKPSLIDNYIESYSCFNDCPWYSLSEKIISKYYQNKNIYFVATIRDHKDWIISFTKIQKWLMKSPNNILYHTYIYGDIVKDIRLNQNKLIDFYHKFYMQLDILQNKYNVKITRLDLSDTTKIVQIIQQIIPIFNTEYPHDNKSI